MRALAGRLGRWANALSRLQEKRLSCERHSPSRQKQKRRACCCRRDIFFAKRSKASLARRGLQRRQRLGRQIFRAGHASKRGSVGRHVRTAASRVYMFFC